MAKFGLKKEDKVINDLQLESKKYDEFNFSEKEVLNDESKFNPWNYIRVVNVSGDSEFLAQPDEKVIIGHRGNPVLGNKHPMKSKTLAERERVISAHKEDLDEDLIAQGPIYQALQNIAKDIAENKQKIAIVCYCAPLKCHNDFNVPIVVKMVQEILNKKSVKKPKI